ncbi:MAG: hypothetical protein ACT4PW_01385 [Acidimicrobiia bacterium]
MATVPRPRPLTIAVAIVVFQAGLLVALALASLLNADEYARKANEKANQSTTTTTSPDAGPPLPIEPKVVTNPGRVRTGAYILLAAAVVETGLCLALLRRDNRARIALIAVMVATAVYAPLLLLSFVVAAAVVYLLQFNREVRQWFLRTE